MMRKRIFLSFNADARTIHTTDSIAGQTIKERLLTAENHDVIVVTYCSSTSWKYTVWFQVTETYVIARNAPLTVYLDKSALSDADCQSHLYRIILAMLEV